MTADGSALFSDNAETADVAWTAAGFSASARPSPTTTRMLVAENRQYVSYDKTLKTGPYNFGFSTTRPSWVEHYPYQNGLLIWKMGHLAEGQQRQRARGLRADPAGRLALHRAENGPTER